jgi:hypothetical protein
MTRMDQLERRCGWIAFPGFLRYYALFHVLVFVLQFIRPDIGSLLAFDRAKIFSGEVWRVVTYFFAIPMMGGPGLSGIIFLIFVVNFAFMVGDGLEAAWGSFRTTLFYLLGILLITAVSFCYPVNIPLGGFMLYGSAFLAFATLFPKTEILIMFILPVQIRFLAILQAIAMILMVVAAPILLPYLLLALLNFILFAGIPALRGTARTIESGKRRKVFNAAKHDARGGFHSCKTCGKTDVSDAALEFRVGSDGEEYCSEHLPQ